MRTVRIYVQDEYMYGRCGECMIKGSDMTRYIHERSTNHRTEEWSDQ